MIYVNPGLLLSVITVVVTVVVVWFTPQACDELSHLLQRRARAYRAARSAYKKAWDSGQQETLDLRSLEGKCPSQCRSHYGGACDC